MFREVFVSDDGILSQAFAAFGWITLAPVPFVANLEETFLDAGAHRPILEEALGGSVDLVWFSLDNLGLVTISSSSDGSRGGAAVLLQWIRECVDALLAKGRGFVISGLADSSLWRVSHVASLRSVEAVSDVELFSCAWGSDRAVEVRFRHNLPELAFVRGGCHHVHVGASASAPPSRPPAFTARLAVAAAAAATRWAIRAVDLPWTEPAVCRPCLHGRVEESRDPAAAGLPALPVALAEFGLASPDGRGRVTRLGRVKLLRSLPVDAVYIGRGFPLLKLGKSIWANPFRVGPDGDRLAVVAKYRAWIATQPDLLRQLPDLHGRLLMCHCEIGSPCHGQVLLQLISQRLDPDGQPLSA